MQFSESCLSPILRRVPLNGSGKSSATIGNQYQNPSNVRIDASAESSRAPSWKCINFLQSNRLNSADCWRIEQYVGPMLIASPVPKERARLCLQNHYRPNAFVDWQGPRQRHIGGRDQFPQNAFAFSHADHSQGFAFGFDFRKGRYLSRRPHWAVEKEFAAIVGFMIITDYERAVVIRCAAGKLITR